MDTKENRKNREESRMWSNKTRYLKEFLMLFLAVFCGYLAEEYRENQQDKQDLKKYLTALVVDVKNDRVQIQNLLQSHEARFRALDTVRSILAEDQQILDSKRLYSLIIDNLGFPDFVPNEAAFQQLKSLGGLRLIESPTLIDTLMRYQRMLETVSITQKQMNEDLTSGRINLDVFDRLAIDNPKRLGPIPLMDSNRIHRVKLYGVITDWWYVFEMLKEAQIGLSKEGLAVERAIKRDLNH